jgi:sporulation protein YlmC with PRC-barrel domain
MHGTVPLTLRSRGVFASESFSRNGAPISTEHNKNEKYQARLLFITFQNRFYHVFPRTLPLRLPPIATELCSKLGGSAVIHSRYLMPQTGKNAMTNAPHFLSASTLTGDAVKNPQGESLGDLKDIMIDTDNGTIAYGVLSFGGVLGLGEKLFAVPWEAIKVDGENEELILNVDKEQLKNAPGFDKDNWPNFADQRFATQIREYYIR